MNSQLIFIPVLVQVLLTIVLYMVLNVRKIRAVKAGDVNEARRGLYDDAWPEYVLKVNNCIRNQFEVPVLFYVVSISLAVLGAVSMPALVLAWLFAASRIAHAYVHTGSNYVPLRRKIFTVGVLIVLLMSMLLVAALL